MLAPPWTFLNLLLDELKRPKRPEVSGTIRLVISPAGAMELIAELMRSDVAYVVEYLLKILFSPELLV